MYGQLECAGCGRNGSASAAIAAAALVIMIAVSSLSSPLLTMPFQLAWISAASNTI
jgi:hypothetical protein